MHGAPGVAATEDDKPVSSKLMPRSASEEAAEAFAERGGKVMIIRLPQVHDTVKQGLVSLRLRSRGKRAWWPTWGMGESVAGGACDGCGAAVQLVLEKGVAGARYHAVAEEGVTAKEMFTVVAAGLKLPVVSLTPEEAQGHFGWLAMFAGMD